MAGRSHKSNQSIYTHKSVQNGFKNNDVDQTPRPSMSRAPSYRTYTVWIFYLVYCRDLFYKCFSVLHVYLHSRFVSVICLDLPAGRLDRRQNGFLVKVGDLQELIQTLDTTKPWVIPIPGEDQHPELGLKIVHLAQHLASIWFDLFQSSNLANYNSWYGCFQK